MPASCRYVSVPGQPPSGRIWFLRVPFFISASNKREGWVTPYFEMKKKIFNTLNIPMLTWEGYHLSNRIKLSSNMYSRAPAPPKVKKHNASPYHKNNLWGQP